MIKVKKSYGPSLEQARYMMSIDYDWDQHNTRELISMLRSEIGRDYTAFHRQLKKVLSTRENIPTKQQAKELRRIKAKGQRNR